MRSAGAFFAAAVLFSGSAVAQSSKIASDLAVLPQDANVSVIVRYHPSVKRIPLDGHTAFSTALNRRYLPRLNAVVDNLKVADLKELEKDPDVAFISPDRKVRSFGSNGWPDYGWLMVGAEVASSTFGLDGRGIGIAVIDSGYTDHADLSASSRITYRLNLVPGASNAEDQYGHGAHVAGIIAGDGTESRSVDGTYEVRGIAPLAHLAVFRVLDADGAGTDSAVIEAIYRAIELKDTLNIRVLNLSLGRPVYESHEVDPLCIAVRQAWEAGIVVVVAAGNEGRNNQFGTDGYGTIMSPGNSPYVITVGALNTSGTLAPEDDKIASYSSKGPTAIDHIVKPDILAPGNRILSLTNVGSTLYRRHPENRVPVSAYTNSPSTLAPDYYQLSGTSMAAPMVTGAAALLLQKDPTLTPHQVKYRLMRTASKNLPQSSEATDPVTGVTYHSQSDIFTIGAGVLNIPAALTNDEVSVGAMLSPVVRFDTATGTVVLLQETSAVWGDFGPWGAWPQGLAAVWGSNAFVTADAAVWGSAAAVWGSAALWGSAAVWGSATVWGSSSQVSSDAYATSAMGEP